MPDKLLTPAQQALIVGLDAVRDDLVKLFDGWEEKRKKAGLKIEGLDFTLNGVTDVAAIDHLNIPQMKIAVMVVLPGPKKEEGYKPANLDAKSLRPHL